MHTFFLNFFFSCEGVDNFEIEHKTCYIKARGAARIPDSHGLLTSNFSKWIECCVQLSGSYLCIKLWVRIGCVPIPEFCLKFIFLK